MHKEELLTEVSEFVDEHKYKDKNNDVQSYKEVENQLTDRLEKEKPKKVKYLEENVQKGRKFLRKMIS